MTTPMDTQVPVDPKDQVTLMNWRFQPYNHWAFRNATILHALMVPRGGDISPLPEAPNPEIPNLSFEYDGQSYTVESAFVGDSTDGVIVIKDGQIVWEAYYNGMGPDDPHIWASSTKTLVAMALGILVEQGRVDPAAPAETYVDELKGSYIGSRAVRDILNMVTALQYTEDYTTLKPGEVNTEYFRRLGFIPAFDLMALDPIEAQKQGVSRGILGYVARFDRNPAVEPGAVFEYHSPNVDVIGWIIARVSGQPLHRFIADHVWKKIGPDHDAFFLTDVDFVAIATGGFNSTLRDAARVGLVVLNNGFYNGQQIFPEAWAKDAFALTDADREHAQRSEFKNPASPTYDPWLEGYRNFLWVHDSRQGIGTFRGVYGQNVYINKSQDLIIANFSSAASPSNASRATNKPRFAAYDAIAAYFAESS